LVSDSRRADRSLATRKALFVLLLAVIASAVAYTVVHNRKWNVPESAKQVQNPIPPSDSALLSIHSIYLDKCSSCHGNFGKGDGHDAALYDPRPTNFTLPLANATDGELFYKISEGRKPMPAYKNKLTEKQRWQLVLQVRAFASRVAQRTRPTPSNR
jgi:mono/diheme cytochrome c family protein